MLFTANEFKVLNKLREKTPEYPLLPYDDFESLCSKYSIGKDGLSREDYLGVLDKLGEVVHFPTLDHLGKYVLNPRWLTYGVYTLLYSEEINNEPIGELTYAQVVAILCGKKLTDEVGFELIFTRENCGFIIEAMEEFKLCYRLPYEERSIVFPDKLSANQPDLKAKGFDSNKPGTVEFEFQFSGFLPRHVMPMFIVAHHHEIKDGLVWQNGAVFFNQDHQTLTRVQVDYHLRTMKFWLQSYTDIDSDGVRQVLAIYQDKVKSILSRMDALEYEERIVLPVHALIGEQTKAIVREEKVPYWQLLAMAHQGADFYITSKGERYDLNKVLRTIMTKDRIKQQTTNVMMGLSVVGATGFDDNNVINGFVNALSQISSVDKKQLLKAIEIIGDGVLDDEGDKQERKAAITELNQLHEIIMKEGELSQEENKQVKDLFGKFKDGSLKFFDFEKVVNEHKKTIQWVAEKATVFVAKR